MSVLESIVAMIRAIDLIGEVDEKNFVSCQFMLSLSSRATDTVSMERMCAAIALSPQWFYAFVIDHPGKSHCVFVSL